MFQEELFLAIQNNEKLQKQVNALCCIDFFKTLKPLCKISDFYQFNIDGKVFASDGGGGYYVLLEDNSFGYVNFAENECGRVASTWKDLLELELNCAYSWHNYAQIKYIENPKLLEKDVVLFEKEGCNDFQDAYDDSMPSYYELQKEIAEQLHLNISKDIAKDILPRFYNTALKQPKFYGKSRLDQTDTNDLIS